MVTVLMCVRDTPVDMLQTAIDSILAQTYATFEFLILDDGSQDPRVRACLVRAAAEDDRIRISWEAHRGLTPTLNLGLRRARAPFVARQDADDWSEPVRFERQLAFLNTHPEIALCGTAAWKHQRDGTRLFRSRGPRTHQEIKRGLPRGNPFIHGSVMFRTEDALAVGGYREEFSCSQDYDFFWRLAELRDVANLPDALYHYRYVSGSVSVERAAERIRAHRAAQKLASARWHGAKEDLAAAFAAEPGDEFTGAHRQADHLLLAGDYNHAWRAYRDALRAHPASAMAWAKIVRYGIFVTLPPVREACFR